MVNHKRRKRLLKLLAEHHTASVPQLVDWLNASPATVRRDISWLAARSLLTRTRGGAANLEQKKRGFTLTSETFQHTPDGWARIPDEAAAAEMTSDEKKMVAQPE